MKTEKLKYITAMSIVGTIGLFVKSIPISSAQIAFTRGIIGALSILIFALLTKKSLSLKRIKKDAILLVLSGIAIGINWILLFEAYKYTTVAIATVCYYTAPLIVILLSPMILKESFTKQKLFCVLLSILGISLISGIGSTTTSITLGIPLALLAACLYAAVIFMNKKLTTVNSLERSLLQLGIAGLSLTPYLLLTNNFTFSTLDTRSLLLLLFIGFIHTGFAYLLYFSSIQELNAHSIAILSYIDPVVAIFVSTLILHETIGVTQIIGSVLIIASSYISER